jgi:hypothetical protein
MAQCGIPRIDALLAGTGAPLGLADRDTDAIGIAQDLLRGHGYRALPDVRGPNYGRFGGLTRAAVLGFRAAQDLGTDALIDGALLSRLIQVPAPKPIASRAFLTLVLDLAWASPLPLVAFTALFESDGAFDKRNRNSDCQGLSFGVIQWAQKPGRLHELLAAFDSGAPDVFRPLAGGAAAAAGLLAHTAKRHGGGDPSTGLTTDPAFDLTATPWRERFAGMALAPELQKIQVSCAVSAFRSAIDALRPQTPLLRSQRGVAFLADLANQHGAAGAADIYGAAAKPRPATEAQLLEAMQGESVRRVAAQYGATAPEASSTAARREFFRTTPLLADAAY